METKPMTTAEAEEVIKREFGNYARYRQSSYANPPTEAEAAQVPKPRTPTQSEQYADACKLVAEYRGISLEQFFKQEPERLRALPSTRARRIGLAG